MIKRIDLRGRRDFTMSRLCCSKCRQPATRRTVAERPTAVIKLDGTVERGTEQVSTFWCSRHVPLSG